MDVTYHFKPMIVLILQLIVLLSLLLLIVKVWSSESFRNFLHVLHTIFTGHPTAILSLLKVAIPSDEERENVTGDLFEEYGQFPSRLNANLWLCKQLLTSFPPLLLKTVKSRLASFFGQRIR